MGEVNRRKALGLFSTAGAATLLGRTGRPAAAGEPPAGLELFVLGPFVVGHWFRARPNKLFHLPDSPTTSDLVRALNQVRVYLLDRRDGKVFADGFPLVAVEGKLRYEWKKGKRAWEVHVVGVRRGGLDTDNSASPPTRDVNSLSVALWTRETQDGSVESEGIAYFSRGSVQYDLTGAIRKS